ncbi:MAG: threonine-phosphate decarboxylase CobD [Actinobacteria bacterium]|nr:threonine-phosphate decarboxylase CobD [Actinomycetota bacterium]
MIEPSQHGGNLRFASQKYGLKEEDFADFSANLNPLGPPAQVIEVIKDNISKIYSYPDTECTQLRKRISSFFGLAESNVIVTNGASELIYLVCEHFSGRKALLIEPGFLGYLDATRAFRLNAAFYFLREDRNFAMNADDFMSSVEFESADIVFTCNPNNPTGTMISHDEMTKVVQGCEKSGAFLVVDESFVELSDFPGDSVIGLARKFKNLLVIRSMTKSYGLAGIRLGYGISNTDIIEDLLRKQPTWSVNSLAQLAGEVALFDSTFLASSREFIALERKRLFEGLRRQRIKAYPSSANFVLFRLLNNVNPELFEEYLGRRGIIIRNCSNFVGLGDGYFRIAVRTREENLSLLAVIGEFLHDAF